MGPTKVLKLRKVDIMNAVGSLKDLAFAWRMTILKRVPLFQMLDRSSLTEICDAMEVHQYEDGHVLAEEGTQPPAVVSRTSERSRATPLCGRKAIRKGHVRGAIRAVSTLAGGKHAWTWSDQRPKGGCRNLRLFLGSGPRTPRGAAWAKSANHFRALTGTADGAGTQTTWRCASTWCSLGWWSAPRAQTAAPAA
eukprot:4275199-Pyramimonas_sp.AAC.1